MSEGGSRPESGYDYNKLLRPGQKRTDSGKMPIVGKEISPTYTEVMPHIHPDQNSEGKGPRFRRKVDGKFVRQAPVQQGTLPSEEKPFEDQIMSTNSGKRKLKQPTPIERQILRADRREVDTTDDKMANRQRWAIKRSKERKDNHGK